MSPGVPFAVSRITGTGEIARMRRSTVRPSMSGIMTSSSTRSGFRELERRECGLSAGGGLDVEPLVGERRGDELADPRLIVHDEHEPPRSHQRLLPEPGPPPPWHRRW